MTGVSAVLDLGDYFFGDPNDPNTISGEHLTANLVMDAVGFAGPYGAGAAAGYYYFESGAANAYGQNILNNQAIDPNYLPMDPGKISFHPKNRASGELPDYKKTRRHDEVIDPDRVPFDPGKA